eukprot:TRINITY_DN1009_c5_g1_i1.p1 TRINITY_DN1009_c5_g1~~TRINITY_DN1009_c5_g1_i1.p1  ORF type:complete len:563 (+),score=60.99 TRINITY_DN1009_c5_g1_i1:81-1769(+)
MSDKLDNLLENDEREAEMTIELPKPINEEEPESPYTASRRPSIIIEEEEDGRETFGKRIEFILTTIGYAVGVGNVWRFPNLCYRHGGGSFLIPYLFALVFLGAPLFLLELAIGQRFRRGTYHSILAIDPRLRSIGIISVTSSTLVGIYYIVIMAWSMLYFFASFQPDLPWSGGHGNSSKFWNEHAVDISTGFYDVNRFNWAMVGCLFVSWIAVYICIRKGVKSSGKVVYLTATLPYVLLVLILVYAMTLEGAGEGVKFYITPRPEKLKDPQVWVDAANQIFYSLGTGFGSLIAYGSYNPKTENVVQDAIMVPAINSFTSIFAGLGVFSILGHLAHTTGQSVETVALSEQKGSALAFIVYPSGLSLFPAPQFFCMCFFAMLFCLGIDSEFATVEVILTFIKDMRMKIPQTRLAAILCISGFLLGLVFVTDAGLYWFEWLDGWSSTFSLMIVALVECLAVTRFYGKERFVTEFHNMSGRHIQRFWWFCIEYFAPVCFVVLIIANFVSLISDGRGSTPMFAYILGWLVSLLPIPTLIYCWFVPYKKPEGTSTFIELDEPPPDTCT